MFQLSRKAVKTFPLISQAWPKIVKFKREEREGGYIHIFLVVLSLFTVGGSECFPQYLEPAELVP